MGRTHCGTRGMFVAALLLVVCVSAAAAERGTIVLLTGERLTDVEYTVYASLGMIGLGAGEQEKRVPFANIAAIFDPSGKNITAGVMGAWYNRPAAIDSSGKAVDRREEGILPSPKTLSDDSASVPGGPGIRWDASTYAVKPEKMNVEKTWTVGVRFSSNYSAPFYNWPKIVNSGFGYEGEVRMAVTRAFGIGLIASRSGLKYDDNFYVLSLAPGWTLSKTISRLQVRRYFMTLQYHRYIDRMEAGGPFLYALVGGGVVSREENLEVWLHHDSYGTDRYILADTSMVQFAVIFGGGITIPVTARLGLDIGASGDIVRDRKREICTYYPDLNYTHCSREFSSVGIFTIQLGLILLL